MANSKPNLIDNTSSINDVFNLLEKVNKQYQDYQKIVELSNKDFFEKKTETSERDINYPLNIIIK